MKLKSLIIFLIIFQTFKIKSQNTRVDSVINGYSKIDTINVGKIYDSFNGVEKINLSPRRKEDNCKCKYATDSSSLAICVYYYLSGKIKAVVNYVGKGQTGFSVFFYENGKIQRQENDYRNIHNNNIVSYFEDGSVEVIAITKNDEFQSKEFYKNGNLKSQRKGNNASKNGEEIHYYENGKRGIEKKYINGKEEGERISYFEDGSVNYKINYKNGKKDGNFVQYHKNGKLYLKGKYSNGEVVSVDKAFDENGKLIGVDETIFNENGISIKR